ncbi:MAG: hypothetical protein SAJ12_20265, partial [Jaaginema sp. PMC 1079.18]|nr:hypothetical protein [Jaaginema sp. PMC 1079.18]
CYIPSKLSISDKEIIRLPLSYFDDSAKIQKTILLCENLNDVALYEVIAKAFLIWKERSHTQLAYDSRGGGGTSIAGEYESIQNKHERMCLCIVDSDKKSPNSKLGSTASNIQSLDNTNNVITQLHILEVREAENLIPYQLLSEITEGNRDREKFVFMLETICASPSVEIAKFIDIKKGTNLKEIVKSNNSNIEDFWRDKITGNRDFSSILNSWCWDNWECEKLNSRPCTCIVVPHFGESTLENITNLCRNELPRHVACKVDQYLRSEWETIGQIIVDWCLAERPMRA